jgi:DNA-binding NarL/FixJ family response regulator
MTALNDCVLIVDDEFLIAEGLRMQMEDMSLRVCGIAASADEAIALAQLHRPKIVLMDMRLLGEKDGVDASLVIHETVGSSVIFITGSREPSTIARIHTDHPAGVLFKPVADGELRLTIERLRTLPP